MKYEEYNDSGIEWIGEMPSHWRVMPIKRTGSFENGAAVYLAFYTSTQFGRGTQRGAQRA